MHPTILPSDIIVNETLNGRFEPHTEADIQRRAIDLLKHGQLQPVGVRKLASNDNKPQLVFGYLRTLAAHYINNVLLPAGGIEVDGVKIPVTSPFKLSYTVVNGDDLNSLRLNIVENLARVGTTIMDLVKNQDSLRRLGMADKEIASLYYPGKSNGPATVIRNARLLALPHSTQLLIHRGVISADSGFALLELNEAEQAEVLAELKAKTGGTLFDHNEQDFVPSEASGENTEKTEGDAVTTADGSKIKTAAIVKAVRNKKIEKGKTGGLPLSFSEFKDAILNWNCEGEDAFIREFSKKLMAFWKADITEKQLMNAVYKLRDEASARVVGERKPVDKKAIKKEAKAERKAKTSAKKEEVVAEKVETPAAE